MEHFPTAINLSLLTARLRPFHSGQKKVSADDIVNQKDRQEIWNSIGCHGVFTFFVICSRCKWRNGTTYFQFTFLAYRRYDQSYRKILITHCTYWPSGHCANGMVKCHGALVLTFNGIGINYWLLADTVEFERIPNCIWKYDREQFNDLVVLFVF